MATDSSSGSSARNSPKSAPDSAPEKAKDIPDAVREVCMSFPEVEEKPSHGMPDFKVNGKTFATFCVNHHGDGHIALWLNAPPGAQAFFTQGEPEHYFVPPYVGPRGWLGVDLDSGLSWDQIALVTRQAYEKTAPASLVADIGETISIDPPTETIDPVLFDPMNSARAQSILPTLDELCTGLPEVIRGDQFGRPAWKAGKKTFVIATHKARRMRLEIWVGVELQATLTDDPRFEIPAYTGHNGWILLDVEEHIDWSEAEDLILGSYRHFALKRMLKALG